MEYTRCTLKFRIKILSPTFYTAVFQIFVAHPISHSGCHKQVTLIPKAETRTYLGYTISRYFPMPDVEPPVVSLKGLAGPSFFRGFVQEWRA